MKQKFYSISLFLSLFTATALLTACADEFDTNYQVEKPASVVEAENLAQYNILQSYVGDGFHLGNTLTVADIEQGTTLASLTKSNFNEVSISDLFVYNKLVDAEGNINMLNPASFAKEADEKGYTLFAPALCASSNINTDYLSGLIASEIVEEPEVTGADLITFEDDELGKTYPMKKATLDDGKGTATVENDPAGESGHVVHVKGTNQSFPAITLKFPAGRKLGDYSDLSLDFYAVSNTAFNQKIVLSMGGKNAEFKSAKEFGCTQKAWSRGKVSIPLAALAFSEDQNKQTEVTIVVGPKQLSCEYYIDNVTLTYKYKPTYEVEKTPEEKFQIIGGELNDYITAAMEAAPSINSWTVADCPVTSDPNLIWKETLGDTYFGYAAQLMHEQRSDAKLFVSEYLMNPEVRATFLHLLTANAIGMDKINGIDAIVSIDAAVFDVQAFATMLTELAATGKQIRLTIQNVTGTSDVESTKALVDVVTTYKQKVQAAQQYGINFQAVTESPNNVGLWTTGFNRKSSYASVADALK